MAKRMFLRPITAVAVIGLLVLLSMATQAAAQGRRDQALQHAMDVQADHTEFLMTNRGVMGVGVGYNAAGAPAIKVFVQTQADAAGLPQALDGVPVTVEVSGMFVARTDPTIRQPRPVPTGLSTGHPDITAGTIGCRVTDGTHVYALSNNHVYANVNNASIGDPVIQPGTYDGGSSPLDDIGPLADFEPIDFNGGDNYIDAAIAHSTTGLLGTSTPADDGYGTPNSEIHTAYGDPASIGDEDLSMLLGEEVVKYGRTTKRTVGTVDTINFVGNVCYECAGPFCFSCKKSAHFVDQIVIVPGSFSAGGDSGSLITTNDANRNPVGLLFAGSSSYTIANRIDRVLVRFGVTVDDAASSSGCTANADCDDGDACNGVETCDTASGTCQPGTPVTCNDGSACTTDSCDPSTGACSFDVITCDDGDACNGVETCDPSIGCQAGTPVDCSDGNACTTDNCDPSTGACSHNAITCNDGSICTDDSCDPAAGCVFADNGTCSCAPIGEFCSSDADCCSNKCTGKPGAKTCK